MSNFDLVREKLASAKQKLAEGKELVKAAGRDLLAALDGMPLEDFWGEVRIAGLTVGQAKAAMIAAGWRDPSPVRPPKRVPNFRDWEDGELTAAHRALVAEVRRRQTGIAA